MQTILLLRMVINAPLFTFLYVAAVCVFSAVGAMIHAYEAADDQSIKLSAAIDFPSLLSHVILPTRADDMAPQTITCGLQLHTGLKHP